ncbi:lytic polysaccharide monooxygenase [Gilvimarinus polysaccharolyticus]|uniref:lytic polysaccharide monooxygenase n=1 Tax=Gilvimarinus polysaccharolyticus TaxID=863921 RepID=UPI00067327EF|nr:lytic polysaccharide monooxygenase [Gilvimarinus polysaccharolyticus]
MNTNNQQPVTTKAILFKPLKNIMTFAAIMTSTVALFSTVDAQAHGYVSSPKSRVIQCKEDGVENPTLPACIAAKAAGNGGLYTPQEVAVGGVRDDHRDFIPDGKLCSVGRSNLAGMDLNRTDWPATSVNPGLMNFVWTNTAAHKTTYFRYYITREGHDFSHPLRWDDLELIHDSGFADQEAVSTHNVNLPYRTGRHVVYSIWQRDWVRDAAEGFYQCIDVDFGNGGGNNSSSSTSSSSSVSSSSSSDSGDTCAALTDWDSDSVYTGSMQVRHIDKRYQAKWWTQGANPVSNSDSNGVWLDLGACGGTPISSSSSSSVSSTSSSATSSSSSFVSSTGNCTSANYIDGSTYANGALVQNGGNEYSCTVGGWCTVGGPYAPGTGWAWNNAWALVRSCN